MTTREAQQIASNRLNKYCRGHCGTLTIAGTQKIKGRWLVDFEAPQEKFTVIVENDGNSKVTVWDKSRDASSQ
jgi:very-short-patch-repair endonuclease